MVQFPRPSAKGINTDQIIDRVCTRVVAEAMQSYPCLERMTGHLTTINNIGEQGAARVICAVGLYLLDRESGA
jgi:hypothetical protein